MYKLCKFVKTGHMNIPTIDLPRVVVIGVGFAGLRLARQINSNHYQVVLIDKNNYHTFQPLLHLLFLLLTEY